MSKSGAYLILRDSVQMISWSFSLKTEKVRVTFPKIIRRRPLIAIGSSIFVGMQCIISIGNSTNSAAFDDFVQNKLHQREKHLIKSNGLSIKVLPELANLFSNSQMISSTFHHFLIICYSTQGQKSFTSKQREEIWMAGKGRGR